MKEIDLKITISPDNEIPAFAGYVNHSVDDEDGPQIVVNFKASLIASTENDIDFKQLFAENVVHEMLHMIQDIFDQAFSEEAVEDAITHARKYLEEKSIQGQLTPEKATAMDIEYGGGLKADLYIRGNQGDAVLRGGFIDAVMNDDIYLFFNGLG